MLKEMILLLIAVQNALALFWINEDDVKYYVFTPANLNPIKLSLGDFRSGKALRFVNPTNSFIIFCHGHGDAGLNYWIEASKNALMEKNDFNIVSVDWGERANNDYYLTSVINVPSIAEYLAKFIMEINEVFEIPYKKFHLIGHSLGAHIIGFTGKQIFATSGQKIGRITGLDPAGQLYLFRPTSFRLSEDDALFVDAIHTDVIQGYSLNLAHADFWPNGGHIQPGCPPISKCSHDRAPLYFLESIISNSFSALKCDSEINFQNGNCEYNKMEYMGFYCNEEARGKYYLNTDDESPYGLN